MSLKKSFEIFEFNLSYAKGMRDCLDGYFKIDKDVKFSDFADFYIILVFTMKKFCLRMKNNSSLIIKTQIKQEP